MGFILNVDLETGSGPTQEAYVRIDNYRFNKVTSEIQLTTTCWLDVEKAHSFNREYLDQPLGNAIGLVPANVLYYPDVDSDGIEVTIPNIFKGSVATRKEIEIPTYEEVEKIVQVPYVSFDENGDEITLYKDEVVVEKEVISTEKVTKDVIDTELVTNIYEFGYGIIKDKLKEFFPEDKIEKY